MNITQLADYIVLCECESFSQAAALRHITQPAFSRRIQALEDDVGTELIARGAKKFRLTVAGQKFLSYARQVTDLSETTLADIRSNRSHIVDPVRIGMPSFLSKTFFPAWYKSLQRKVPGLMMSLSHQYDAKATQSLEKGLTDFALVWHAAGTPRPFDEKTFAARKVTSDAFVAVTAPRCRNDKDILMYKPGTYFNHCAEKMLGDLIIKGRSAFETQSTGLMKEMAVAGFGIVVLPESMIAEDLKSGALETVAGTKKMSCDVYLIKLNAPMRKKAEQVWASAK